MTAFIEQHRERFGVEPICEALQFAPSTYYAALKRRSNPSAREIRDRELIAEIHRVFAENRKVYGANKLWHQLKREGIHAPRCQIERLMRAEGLAGVVRGRRSPRTTCADERAERAADLVDREFRAAYPNQLWVADFTYVFSWEKLGYVAFVIDVFSRRIVGWRVASSMKTELVLDAFEMALWSRDHEGLPAGEGLIVHSDAGSQYTSFSFTRRLIEAGVDPSVGSVGDAYDNAMAEATIALFKAEVIEHEGPWRTLSDIELATLTWVDWFNNRRLHGACGYLPPVEFEANHLSETVTQ